MNISLNELNREDKLHDHCGVFGVFNNINAAEITTLGLYALQHRGQEAVGLVTSNSKNKTNFKGSDLL